MIVLPSRGIAARQRTVMEHHIEVEVFSDWIEACALIYDSNVSSTDVMDILIEEELYEEQDFAREIVDTAFLEIDRRARLCPGAYGVRVDGEWVKCTRLAERSLRFTHFFWFCPSQQSTTGGMRPSEVTTTIKVAFLSP